MPAPCFSSRSRTWRTSAKPRVVPGSMTMNATRAACQARSMALMGEGISPNT